MRTAITAIALTVCLYSPCVGASSNWPAPVRQEVAKLIESCRSAGGTPRSIEAGVSRSPLTSDEPNDYVIDTSRMDCAGAMTVWGGTAGQTLILVPANGRGIRQLPAHSWRIGEGSPPVITVVGGFDCAMGRHDRCDAQLRWDGRSFVRINTSGPATTGSTNRSIVGDWAETRDGCSSPMAGRTSIRAMSISNDEFVCRFDSVSRSGATVTWTGSCDDGQGPSKRKSTVTATETAGKLTVRVNGNAWAPMLRCPAAR